MTRQVLIALLIVFGCAAPGGAQPTSDDNESKARAGFQVGYGGHGADWDTSIDSPLLLGIGRFRSDIGSGRWAGLGDEAPRGSSPRVTRIAVTAILFIPWADEPRLRTYLGLGTAVYMPQSSELDHQRGTRVIWGLETSTDRWDIGPEMEFDLPTAGSDQGSTQLAPSVRVGVALRRRF